MRLCLSKYKRMHTFNHFYLQKFVVCLIYLYLWKVVKHILLGFSICKIPWTTAQKYTILNIFSLLQTNYRSLSVCIAFVTRCSIYLVLWVTLLVRVTAFKCSFIGPPLYSDCICLAFSSLGTFFGLATTTHVLPAS